jgi:hypothetical protein
MDREAPDDPPDPCNIAPLLHALPSATDEQREAALFCLTGPLIPAMRLIVINRMSRVEEKGGSDDPLQA